MTTRLSKVLLFLALTYLSSPGVVGRGIISAADSQTSEEGKETLGLRESAAPLNAARIETSPPVQQFCQGPEDLRACDSVRDGVCIISSDFIRLRRRRRWRQVGGTSRPLEPRWVEGLTIRTSGDIEVSGSVIQCTQAAPLWGPSVGRRSRLRGRGPQGGPRRQGTTGWGIIRVRRKEPAVTQRIELCASGSIRLLAGSKLHCEEVILFAGDSVSLAETSEVTASGTVSARRPPTPLSATGPLQPLNDEASFAVGVHTTEFIAARLQSLLGIGVRGTTPEEASLKGAYSNDSAASGLSPSSSLAVATAPGVKDGHPIEGISKHKPQLPPSQGPELRGGSHGGLGGVANDRCEAKAFSHPLRVLVEARGNLFLPIHKGEAGLAYPCRRSRIPQRMVHQEDLAGGPMTQHSPSVEAPKGGGLVVIVALGRLAVEGQVTASGEPGWECEAAWEPPGGLHHEGPPEVQGDNSRVKPRERGWGISKALIALLRRLAKIPSRLREAPTGGTTATAPVGCCKRGASAASCATGGSGGSIVLVAESLSFASPMQSGRVTATGGGCLGAPPGWCGAGASGRPQEPQDTFSGDCAAGGGGRIAIYAEQPHPLDPVVVASGGCPLRSSRLDLLPCLCGGGGTIFSRVHRRLVIANKLTVAAAVRRSPPGAPSDARSQIAKPHVFQTQEGSSETSGSGTPRSSQRFVVDDEGAQARGRVFAPLEASVPGSPPGTDALAVLSIQPTPLPVPLHAPSITLAVEAAVVTIGAFPARPAADSESPARNDEASLQEPKVVVGSLLLHGGTRGERSQGVNVWAACLRKRLPSQDLVSGVAVFGCLGSALHVLRPLHLHAAEGSIRLRQQSALVLAPCGSYEAEGPTGGPHGASQGPSHCHYDRLPHTGSLLESSIVISSAVSVSVGENAAIRFLTGPRNFGCRAGGGDPGGPPAVTSPQSQGTPQSPVLGLGLLAGERLLLHGELAIDGVPSDCLPAPVKQTPMLLFGGREVSLKGEQHLDRLVILSQGTVSLAGTSSVGPPHRCDTKPTKVTPRASQGSPDTEVSVKYSSSICSALATYADTHVAPQLQSAAEIEGASLGFFFEGPPSEDKGHPLNREEAPDNHPMATGSPSKIDNSSSSKKSISENSSSGDSPSNGGRIDSGSADKEQADTEADVTGWIRKVAGPPGGVAARGPHERAPELFQSPSTLSVDTKQKRRQTTFLSSFLRRFADAGATDAAASGHVLARIEQRDAIKAPYSTTVLRRKRQASNRGYSSSRGPPLAGAITAPWGPHERLASIVSVASLNQEGNSVTVGSPLQEGSHERFLAAAVQEPLLLPSSAEGSSFEADGKEVKDPATHLGNTTGLEDPESALLMRGTPPWIQLDAAVFARQGLVVEGGASLSGGALLLCGGEGNTILQGIIDASGRGCQPTHGPGAGSRGTAVEVPSSPSEAPNPTSTSLPAHSALCGAGGGAHVGSGGAGVHALTGKPCAGSGGQSYDRRSPIVFTEGLHATGMPNWQNLMAYASNASASGGGGDLARAGSGGGTVWIQGQTVTVEGQILADGGGGELMQDAIIDLELPSNSCGPLIPAPEGPSRGFKEGTEETPGDPHVACAESSEGAQGRRDAISETNEYTAEKGGKLSGVSEKSDAVFRSSNVNSDDEHLMRADAEGTGEDKPRESVSCQLSGILSDPAQLGQGGGAGGSVVIETGALRGGGLISAKGGHGGRCTGGGGGGGAINLLWYPTFFTFPRHYPGVQRHKTRGRVGVDSGSSNREEEALSLEGRADMFIPWLRPLDFSAGFSGTLLVNGGGSDPSDACRPLQLPLGREGAPGEILNPLGCPPGYAGWKCSPCPVGFFSDGGGRACVSCRNKPPSNAFYTQEGVGGPQCPYSCSAGLPDASVNPKCLPPFLFILERLLCCAVLLPLGALCVCLLGLSVLLREMPCRRGQQGWGGGYAGILSAAVRFILPTSVSAVGTGGYGGPYALFRAVQPSPSGSMGFFVGSRESRLLHLAVRHLTLEDLPFHVLRIYLHGRNSPHSPWGLEGQPPSFLESLITPNRYAAFAAAVNNLCGFSACFVRLYGALSLLYPPLAVLLLRAARARRADRMVTLCSTLAGRGPPGAGDGDGHSSGDPWMPWGPLLGWRRGNRLRNWLQRGGLKKAAFATSFWRSIRARELSFALKFGCDADCTVGFIDVLDLDRNILDYRCSPQLPLVLLTQGDGRIVPFSLSGTLRDSGDLRTAQGLLHAEGKDSPADPLQGALEEFASPSVWAALSSFFTAKVKEITAEELAALRTLAAVVRPRVVKGDECESSGGQHESVGWSAPFRVIDILQGGIPGKEEEEPSGFYRCGRCGRLQLPSGGSGGLAGGGPLGLLMGDPLYALRAIARLCEGVRLMSNRLLRPHGIAASVCLLTNRGFVNRTDGVRRVIGAPQGAPENLHPATVVHRAWGPPSTSDTARGPGGKSSSSATQRGEPSVSPGPSVRQGPLDTGRLLLRAASSPSALLESLRCSNSGDALLPLGTDTDEGTAETMGGKGPFSGSDVVGGTREGCLAREKRSTADSSDPLLSCGKCEEATQKLHFCEEGAAKVETDAVLALVITEDAPESDGESLQAPSGDMRERGHRGAPNVQVVKVPCFPSVCSLAVTSPLDPRHLSPLNKPLAPYTAAAGSALNKSIPYWIPGGSPIPHYATVNGGPSSLRHSFDKLGGPSPRHNMPNSLRTIRKSSSPSNDPSPADSQGPSSAAESPSGSPDEAPYSSHGGPVMCLADAAKRSAGADAQHLRNAVEALQKSALAKLGTGPPGVDVPDTQDESLGFSRVTTDGAAEAQVEKERSVAGGRGNSTPQGGLHPLALLQLAWRRLRFRSVPTDLARAYVLAAALAVQLIHVAATCVYLFGLKNISFAMEWPQPFPAGTPATGGASFVWSIPVNSFWFRTDDPTGSLSLVASPPLQGAGVGPSPAGNAVSKWAGLKHSPGGPSWGLLAVALSVPPFADLVCFFVGLWLFLAADTRQEQLFRMTVVATMPKHVVVYGFLLVFGAPIGVSFFGLLELIAMAAIKVLLCHLASMYASRVERPDPHTATPTKESELLFSVAQECEQAADICSCRPFEGRT